MPSPNQVVQSNRGDGNALAIREGRNIPIRANSSVAPLSSTAPERNATGIGEGPDRRLDEPHSIHQVVSRGMFFEAFGAFRFGLKSKHLTRPSDESRNSQRKESDLRSDVVDRPSRNG